MLIYRSILDLVKLIELSFKNHEISSWLWVQVNNIALKLFESVNNFEEVLMCKEKLEVFLVYFLNNLLHWIKVSILIEKCLQMCLNKSSQYNETW